MYRTVFLIYALITSISLAYSKTSSTSKSAKPIVTVTPLYRSLDKIYAIRGVKIKRGETSSGSGQAELVPEEVEKIYPEAVKRKGQHYKYVDTTRLVPHMIEAIKELNVEIKHLKKENETLKSRLDKIENSQ